MTRPVALRLKQLIRRHPAIRLMLHESRIWIDLWRLAGKRRVVVPGAKPIAAEAGLWGLPMMFTAATAIEVIALELLLPWPGVRLLLVLLSVYSLVMLWGLIAQRVVHPHAIGEEVVLRRGRAVVTRFPVGTIAAVRKVRDFAAESHRVADGRLELSNGHGANVCLRLTVPVLVDPPSWPWQRTVPEPVREIALWVDDPEGMVSAVAACSAASS